MVLLIICEDYFANMFLNQLDISKESIVADLVAQDYRTSDVFKKYGIGFCCGGKYPLQMACEINNVDVNDILEELQTATSEVNVSNTLQYKDWPLDFLADYIVNVHHQYLKKALPQVDDLVAHFTDGHRKKYSYLDELHGTTNRMVKQMLPHMEHEEKVIFPYVRQIQHAYQHSEPYAGLFVKTLRKPIELMMAQEHETTGKDLLKLRELTNNYTPPSSACLTHKVAFSKLKEVDCDISRHLYLENEILFPQVVEMEKKLTV